MNIYDYLLLLRTKQKISQKNLSKSLGIPIRTIRNIESRKIIPTNEILKIYSDYFNISIDFLLNLKNNELEEECKKVKKSHSIGQYLTFLRQTKNLIQTDLSKKLNISTPTLRKLEKTERLPSEEELEKYAQFFNISIKELRDIKQKTIVENINKLSLSESLIFIRKVKNLTQKDFSILIDIPFKELREIENEQRIPSYDILEKYAEISNIPIEKLLKLTADFKVKKINDHEKQNISSFDELKEKEDLLLFNQFDEYQIFNLPLYNSKEDFLEKKSHEMIDVLMSKDTYFTSIDNLFGYRIHDNAMNKVLAVNTVAIVDSKLKPKDGNVIMFKLKNQVYIRRLKVIHDNVYLNSESFVDNKLNFSFPKDQFEHFEFLGTVIHVIIDNYYINH